METPPFFPHAFALGFSLLACSLATGEPPDSPPDRTAKRPKFTSKIHIPVKPAAEVTPLPPAGCELISKAPYKWEIP